MNVLLGVILALGGMGALLYGNNRWRIANWYGKAARCGQTVLIEGRRFFYRLKGTGPITLIVESALGAPSAEWWQLQDQLAPFAQVLTFDRPGYGWSDPSLHSRTSEQAARELQQLLDAIGLQGPIILIGHSLGGLYVNHFARLHPDRICAAILLDPASPRDAEAQQQLPPEVYRGSGWDKTSGLKLMATLNRLGLLRYLKPLMLKAPPFYYYKDMPPEYVEVIWQHLLNPHLATTALDEYQQMHLPQNNAPLLSQTGFPPVALKVIYHTPQVIVDETMKYGGLSGEQAWQMEKLWECLTREYLVLSPRSEWITTTHASHFIHTDQPELVLEVVKQLLEEVG